MFDTLLEINVQNSACMLNICNIRYIIISSLSDFVKFRSFYIQSFRFKISANITCYVCLDRCTYILIYDVKNNIDLQDKGSKSQCKYT